MGMWYTPGIPALRKLRQEGYCEFGEKRKKETETETGGLHCVASALTCLLSAQGLQGTNHRSTASL